MLYFAYGSNMDWPTMTAGDRCPSAQFLLRAKLPEYMLAFTRTSTKRRCGVADILPKPGGVVWGVVYHIDEGEREKLDKAEGVHVNAYRPLDLMVLTEGDGERRLRVRSYEVCTKENPHPKPSADYKSLLVSGATRWRLPSDYVEQLNRIETL